MDKLTSSVIICTRNRMRDVIAFLESLKIQTVQPTEVIIVDSSDKRLDGEEYFTKTFTQAYFISSRLLYKHTQPGLTYQRNVGLDNATSDIIYFFDDDVILTPLYLEEMQKIFEHYPKYAGGMGAISNSEPLKFTPSRIIRLLFLLQRDYASGNFTYSGMPTHTYGLNIFKLVKVLGGCCMAYRSTVVKKYRFDENLHAYCAMEDCDISWRISRSYTLFYNPRAQLEHHKSPLNRDKVIDNRAMYITNYSYLFFKNVYPTRKLKLIAYMWSTIGLFIEALIISRNRDQVKGYIKGLRMYYTESGIFRV